MKLELTEALWLDESGAVTLLELAECSGMSEAELVELVELGVIEPLDPDAGQWSFGSRCIVAARAASRLRRDFELDSPSLAVVLSLLERVHELESQVRHMHARLPRMRR